MHWLVIALLVLVPTAFAKKDPAIEARKDFVHRWLLQAEQSGYPCARWGGANLGGKHKDTFELIIINISAGEIMSLENACVEPHKSEMKSLGFTGVEIRSDAYGPIFPDGIWRIAIN